MRILGIDPGSAATGYGVVEMVEGQGGRLVHVAHGTLRPPRTAPLAARLAAIHRGVGEIVAAHEPDRVVVEQVLMARNPRSALVLGAARGVALAAAAGAGLPVDEVGPRQIKLAVVGSGAAVKSQVQAMVQRLLSLERPPAQDAADALAAAIWRLHHGEATARGGRRGRRLEGGRLPAAAHFVLRRSR
jgi:crossover junction endodeoxyribonuclease RuvC